MKISKSHLRRIIRESIQNVIKEEGNPGVYYPEVEVVSSEEIEGSGSRMDNVTFEGAKSKVWKPAHLYKTVTNEMKEEIWDLESPIPYIYDDKAKWINRNQFIRLFPKGGKEIWDHDEEFAKVKNKFGNLVPRPAKTFSGCIGTPTIGTGHALQTESEFDEYSQYNIFKIHDSNASANSEIGTAELVIELGTVLMQEQELKHLFEKYLIEHMRLNDRITKPITQSMFDALTSFAFNAGWEEKNKKGKTRPIQFIINYINKGQYTRAKNLMGTIATTSKGEFSEGLDERRQWESKRFGEDGLVAPEEESIRLAGSDE